MSQIQINTVIYTATLKRIRERGEREKERGKGVGRREERREGRNAFWENVTFAVSLTFYFLIYLF